MSTTCHYETLGLTPDASHDDIVAAYRQLRRKVHPDVGGSAALFRAVQEAWEALGTDGARAVYDRDRAAGTTRQAPRTNGTSRRSQDHPPHEARQQPPKQPPPAVRQHVNVGTVGGGLQAGLYADSTGTAGLAGEQAVAAALDRLDFGPDAWIFHDVVPPGGDGNIDHVIVSGATVYLLDAKRWRPGRYSYRRQVTHHRDVAYDDRGRPYERTWDEVDQWAWRDGQLFDPAVATGFQHLIGVAAAALPDGLDIRPLLVATSADPNGRFDFSDYAPPAFAPCTVDELPELAELCRRNERPIAHPSLLTLLRGWTSGVVDAPTAPPAPRPGVADTIVEIAQGDGTLDVCATTVADQRRQLRRHLGVGVAVAWATLAVSLTLVVVGQTAFGGALASLADAAAVGGVGIALIAALMTALAGAVTSWRINEPLRGVDDPGAQAQLAQRRWLRATLNFQFDQLGTDATERPAVITGIRKAPTWAYLAVAGWLGGGVALVVTGTAQPTLLEALVGLSVAVWWTGRVQPEPAGSTLQADAEQLVACMADPQWWPWVRAALRYGAATGSVGALPVLAALERTDPQTLSQVGS